MTRKIVEIWPKRAKPFAFYFHYNKPASRRLKRNVLTLHAQGACHLVYSLECHGFTRTVARATQPRCVIAGQTWGILIKANRHAVIRTG